MFADVENNSSQVVPSLEDTTEKDFAGASQLMRSVVIARGAPKSNESSTGTRSPTLLAQYVAPMPSTAAQAPCVTASNVELAAAAERRATSSEPAETPD